MAVLIEVEIFEGGFEEASEGRTRRNREEVPEELAVPCTETGRDIILGKGRNCCFVVNDEISDGYVSPEIRGHTHGLEMYI